MTNSTKNSEHCNTVSVNVTKIVLNIQVRYPVQIFRQYDYWLKFCVIKVLKFTNIHKLRSRCDMNSVYRYTWNYWFAFHYKMNIHASENSKFMFVRYPISYPSVYTNYWTNSFIAIWQAILLWYCSSWLH